MADFKQWVFRNSIISGTAVLAMAILLVLVGGDITGRVKDIKIKRQDLASRTFLIESLASLRADASRADNLLGALKASLPPKDQLIGFSKTLEGFAKTNQLGFGFAFDSETVATESAPGSNSFTLTLKGSFSNLIRFLRAVESSKYFVDFSYFDVVQKGNDFEIIIKGRVFSE